MIIERYPERLGAPKAHALCPRSLEICRQFHIDVRKIRRLGTKRADAYWVHFLTNLAGKSVGVLPYERMDVGVLKHTPEVRWVDLAYPPFLTQKMLHNIPQPVFEQYLTELIADEVNVDLRKGVSFVGLEQVSANAILPDLLPDSAEFTGCHDHCARKSHWVPFWDYFRLCGRLRRFK